MNNNSMPLVSAVVPANRRKNLRICSSWGFQRGISAENYSGDHNGL